MKKADQPITLKRQWTDVELYEVWAFCQHDFVRFIQLLLWLETK